MGMGVQPASTIFSNNLHTFSRFIYIILKYNSYVYFVLYQRYGTGYSSAIIVWLVKDESGQVPSYTKSRK